jgi:2,4-dienoyl-CoA reductase (NADPH2)
VWISAGWIHRAELKKRGVTQMGGCKYLEVTDEGLVIETKGARQTLPVDTVVVCAGQDPERALQKPLTLPGTAPMQSRPPRVFLIGGSQEASELDAKRAIDQGTRCEKHNFICTSTHFM